MKIRDKLRLVLALKSFRHHLWLTIGKAECPGWLPCSLPSSLSIFAFPHLDIYIICPLSSADIAVKSFSWISASWAAGRCLRRRQGLGQPSPSREFGEQITLAEPALGGLKWRNILTQGQGKLNKGLWNKMPLLRLEGQLHTQTLKWHFQVERRCMHPDKTMTQ